ncbi:MAG: glycosyltransferase, partial [Gammaproteobacteria bacterium]
MRVLAHIHTFNDADIIDGTIEAVRRQTRAVDEILVVDNASTDGTLDQPSVQYAKVLRHRENLGTSGAVVTGMRFAMEHGYDWIWVFDADSTPDPDALQALLDLYAGWPRSLQEETGFLACLPYNVKDGFPYHASLFSRYGLTRVTPEPGKRYYRCHVTIWSGSLYRVAAIRRIGLPNPDYVLDWGETEYAYHVMKAGYKAFMHQDAVLQHNIRGHASLTQIDETAGPAGVTFSEFPPIRCYYLCRNAFYFALYDAATERFRQLYLGMLILMLKFLVRPQHHG